MTPGVRLRDPRLTPARADVAALSLRGEIEAARFVEGRLMRVIEPQADLRKNPRSDEGLETQLLFGEAFTVYDTQEGWAWGQAQTDSYVGYVPSYALAPQSGPPPTHVVAVPRSFVFPVPDFKATPLASLSLGARLRVSAEDGRYVRMVEGHFVPAIHVQRDDAYAPDYVSVAEQLLGVPYLWGGRTSLGLDCSGLLQLALQRAGIEAPRDTDLQEQMPARDLGPAAEDIRRGDLVFWEGHVGIMLDSLRLIHGNSYQMAVATEPLAVARARIAAAGLPVKTIRRLARGEI